MTKSRFQLGDVDQQGPARIISASCRRGPPEKCLQIMQVPQIYRLHVLHACMHITHAHACTNHMHARCACARPAQNTCMRMHKTHACSQERGDACTKHMHAQDHTLTGARVCVHVRACVYMCTYVFACCICLTLHRFDGQTMGMI